MPSEFSFAPKFDPETEKELVVATREIAAVIAHFGFYTRDDQRIEIDMPVPMPIARHLAERGVRVHLDLASIKPAKSEQGEDIWVPVNAAEAPAATDDIEPEQLEQLKGLAQTLMDRINQAEALHEAQQNGGVDIPPPTDLDL